MERKTIAVAILVVITLALGYYILANPAIVQYIPAGSPVNASVFLENVAGASALYIVMDVRGASPATKQNILQCGVDFASSTGLADKNITNMALEENGCIAGTDTHRTVASCVNELREKTLFYITAGDTTLFYPRAAWVGIGEKYRLNECGVRGNARPTADNATIEATTGNGTNGT